MPQTFNINNNDVVALTNKLEKIHRSAMPVSVRESLNMAASEMKTKFMFDTFDDNFIVRRKTFLKSHTAYNRSKNTFDLRQMSAEAGVIGGKDIAGDRLEMQERGGNIASRSVPAYEGASSAVRISGSTDRRQKSKLQYSRFKGMKKGLISKTRQITIIKTKNRIFEMRSGGRFRTLYVLNRPVRINKDPFIEPAGNRAHKLIPQFYAQQGQKRIDNIMRKK